MSSSLNDYLYFAYLDVLGYKNFLEDDHKKNELFFKDKLTNAFHIFDDVNGSVFQCKVISDSIFLKCNDRNKFLEFLSLIKKIYISFIEQGLYLRGGVSYGKHFETDRITYSHVLAKAYELEQNVAYYPRVVIDTNIIEMFESSKSDLISSQLIIKTGSIFFLNIVDSDNWVHIFNCAKSIYNANIKNFDINESARIKHILFQSYLVEMMPINSESHEKYIKIERFW
jgi:hypothetical protein